MSELTYRNILRNFCKSCCRIECTDYDVDPLRPSRVFDHSIVSGSGFLIDSSYLPSVDSSKRYILTNFHVVDGCIAPHQVLIYFSSFGKESIVGHVVRAFPQLDLAIILCNSSKIDRLESLPIVETVVPNFTKAFALGYPLASNEVHVSEGTISGWDDEHIQLNISINNGNSGGPIIVQDNDGNFGVAAVSVASADGSEAIAFGIPLLFLSLYQRCVSRVLLNRPIISLFPETVCELRCNYIMTSHPEDVLMVMGFRSGDKILSINHTPVDSHGELQVMWKNKVHWTDRNMLYTLVAQGGCATIQRNQTQSIIEWPPLPSINPPVIREKYPVYEPVPDLSFGAVTVSDLSMNIVRSACESQASNLAVYLVEGIKRHEARVVVTDVDVNSTIYSDKIIRNFDVVTHVDGNPISTISEITSMPHFITINDTITLPLVSLK